MHDNFSQKPIVTVHKYLEYKRCKGLLEGFRVPKIVIVCYQERILQHFLKNRNDLIICDAVSHLYYVGNTDVAILSGMGVGAPALAIRIENLCALGAKKIITVGTAGTLIHHAVGEYVMATKALAEDGVAQHYLPPGVRFAEACPKLQEAWCSFAKKYQFPCLAQTYAWSFSAFFKETPADISRVIQEGCGIVEMEAATLYAIAEEKGVQALSLFVISDVLTQNEWHPHLQEPKVKERLYQLANWVLEYGFSLQS